MLLCKAQVGLTPLVRQAGDSGLINETGLLEQIQQQQSYKQQQQQHHIQTNLMKWEIPQSLTLK